MLIRFKVSNFLSFKEETEFSMVAGKERLHPHHVVKGVKNQPNLLRAALLYGANAAGKSNFVKAIEFAKELVLFSGKKNLFPISFKPDSEIKKKPTTFVFEIITEGKVYEYGFKIYYGDIKEEWLIEYSQNTKISLFRRHFSKDRNIFDEPNFLKKKSDKEFLEFVQRSTTADRLFLTHCIDNNVPWFEDVYNWFRDSLLIIYPNTQDYIVGKKLSENIQFKNFFVDLLSKSGTGITSVELEENQNDRWFKKIGENEMTNDFVNMQFIHKGKAKFEEEEESDGTRRLFDLAFPFYDLAINETPKIYIIDELERNLHTNLSYMLLKSYLEQTGKGQLIATTHDTHLLDLELLRKDEIWFAEKDEHGATQLYSLYEFNPRYDKKIEKEYLTGRFGAIPFLGNFEFKKQLAKNGKSKK